MGVVPSNVAIAPYQVTSNAEVKDTGLCWVTGSSSIDCGELLALSPPVCFPSVPKEALLSKQ